MTFSYDRLADVMYVTFERLPNQAYIYVENESGDILRMDRTTQRVVGITIPYFLERLKNNKLEVPEIGAVPFNDIAEELAS